MKPTCSICAFKQHEGRVRPEMKDVILVACYVAGHTMKEPLEHLCEFHKPLAKDALQHVMD